MKQIVRSTLKLLLLIIAISSFVTPVFAQENDLPTDSTNTTAHEESNHLFKLNFLDNPGVGFGGRSFFATNGFSVGYELKLSPRLSTEASIGIRPHFFTSRGDSGRNNNLDVAFTAQLGGRYYYNILKRIAAGKTTDNFSANYIGLNIKKIGSSERHPEDLAIEAVYGIQRKIGDKFYVDFGMGLQYLPNAEGGKISPVFSLKLGFAF